MYKVNIAESVNTMRYKSGIKWRYRGKVEDWKKEDWVVNWRNYSYTLGVKVVNEENGEVVFYEFDEKRRPSGI